uniref:PemK-like protein n=1 Tax=Chlorobium chlorochromatii (strain CaD3) TaxID=340177 RepID=Q3AST9_CHLCH
MVGEIYLAQIYFTDLSEYKIRPVLIVKELGDDCMCLQLTSQLNYDGILITNNDLFDGYLKKDSMILMPKNFTLHKSILKKYLARIKLDLIERIMNQLCKALGCV